MTFVDRFFGGTFTGLQKAMDLTWRRNEAIVSNIANAETPGYAASSFQFEDSLRQAIDSKSGTTLAVSHPSHFPLSPVNIQSVTGEITKTADKTGIGDENSVNLEQEMLNLSENELVYETSAQLLQKKLSQLRFVIAGGQ